MAENLIRVLGREFRFSQVYPSNEKYFKGRSNFGGKGDDSPARKLESRILLIIIHRCKGRRASVHRFDIVPANFSTSRIITEQNLVGSKRIQERGSGLEFRGNSITSIIAPLVISINRGQQGTKKFAINFFDQSLHLFFLTK